MSKMKVLFVLALGALAAFAQEVTVSGTVKLKKRPEIATFQLSVQGKARSGDKAQAEMLGAIGPVQEALKKLGLEFSTLSTGITENKARRRMANDDVTIVVNGFVATTVYLVKLNDLSKLPKALEVASIPGVSKLASLEFDLRDRSAAEREARSAAVKDAVANAEAIVKAAGASAFQVLKIQQNKVDFKDPFGEIVLPMDSVRSGGRGWNEDEGSVSVRGQAMALMAADRVRFTDTILIPGEMEVTTSIVMSVKVK